MAARGWEPEWREGSPQLTVRLPPRPVLRDLQKQKLLDKAVEEELRQGVIMKVPKEGVRW